MSRGAVSAHQNAREWDTPGERRASVARAWPLRADLRVTGRGRTFTASIHQGNVLLPLVTCLSFRSVHRSLMGPARGITGQNLPFQGGMRTVKKPQDRTFTYFQCITITIQNLSFPDKCKRQECRYASRIALYIFSIKTMSCIPMLQLLHNSYRLGFPGLLAMILMRPCLALDLEPRQWSHLPIGTDFLGVGYAHTDADISFDPVLLLEDVKMELHTWAGRYIRTFELLGKSARIDLTQAYQQGKWTGLLDGIPASTSRSGWSDTFLRLAINLYGAPPLRGNDFSAYRTGVKDDTIMGVGLAVRLPTGEYMEDKLINLGENRFAFRPQVGINHTRGRWTAEVTGEVAFYTDNDEFFNGNTREQEPIYITHGHLSYTFRPGLWVGAGVGYGYGGESRINGVNKDDKKQDIAWAIRFAYPFNRYSGVNISYIGNRTLESTGSDSDTLTAGLSISW
jgi:hypothetical protein